MINILEENQVNLHTLANHIEGTGLDVVSRDFDDRTPSLLLISDIGLNFRIFVEENRKFVRFSTYLPIDKSRDYQTKLQFIQELNYSVFLPGFSLDSDDDLFIQYYMSYTQGLNLGQFTRVLGKFSDVIDHIVNTKNSTNLILFPDSENANNEEPCQSLYGINISPRALLN